jgi:predicted dehydrogenase
MIAILGSGFGLYGYLPALAGLGGQRVILPTRYRERFEARPELAPFAGSIVWVDTEKQALEQATGAVIALQPQRHPEKARLCLDHSNIRWLIVEKPLAAAEPEATRLLADLVASHVPFRIGYTLGLTAWSHRLHALHAEGAVPPLRIDWHFMAHHFRHGLSNWKGTFQEGGGPLRFYGIHLLALFAELGYGRVERSAFTARQEGEIDRWSATLSGPALAPVEFNVDTRSDENRFAISTRVNAKKSDWLRLRTPFDEASPAPAFPGVDGRVPLLHRLLASFDIDSGPLYRTYGRTQDLWREAEALAALKDRY